MDAKMFHRILFFAIILAETCVQGRSACEGYDPKTKPVVDRKYPWTVSVQVKFCEYDFCQFWHICSGSLIRDDLVLISAHCVLDWSERFKWQVVLGINNLTDVDSEERQVFKVTNFTHHPDVLIKPYSLWMNDIAVLQLDGAANTSTDGVSVIRPSSLNETDFEGKGLQNVGWGWYVGKMGLWERESWIADDESVKEAFRINQQELDLIKKKVLFTCIPTDRYYGDSAAQLVHKNGEYENNWEYVGIEAKSRAYTSFTKLSPFLSWIDEQIEKLPNNVPINTKSGKKCHIPFRYHGEEHKECIEKDGKRMCPTRVKANWDPYDPSWEECEEK